MAELTSDDRKRELEYANKLSLLAAEAPSVFSERATHRLAQALRSKFGFSPRLKKQEIIRLVRVTNGGGGVSIAELIELTGWHKDELYDLTKELETEHPPIIEFRKLPQPGRGRPNIVIVYLERNFSPPVTINTR